MLAEVAQLAFAGTGQRDLSETATLLPCDIFARWAGKYLSTELRRVQDFQSRSPSGRFALYNLSFPDRGHANVGFQRPTNLPLSFVC